MNGFHMGDNLKSKEEWGTYRSDVKTDLILFLVKIGLARGVIGKFIRKKWAGKNPKVIDAEVRGIKYRLSIGKDNVTDEKILLSSKVYDSEEINELLNSGGNTFVDIGANIGYYSLSLAQKSFNRIIAIEPNPITLKRLKFNVETNNYSETIKIAPYCVGPGGVVDFFCDGDLGTASLHSEGMSLPPTPVSSKPLLEILAEEKINSIDSMKIDIEGYEDQALIPFYEKAPKSLWPTKVVIEHTSCKMWERDVVEYLLDGKYHLVRKTRGNVILRKI